ncbi:glycoside hydrolase 3 protein [Maublancomyces gigas]|uniref:glucan 1,3-beta-glucosidase n=1 Tax=Discina gigas TaxID=1032678 RepID=A0ABR3GGF2_9PEZI
MVSTIAILKGALLALPCLVAATGQLGFSLGVKHNPDGNCKFTEDFKKDLDVISGTSKIVRIYAVSDCNTMEQLMPAIIDKGFKIILGVWPNDDAHFALEKAALSKFIPLYGTDHIYAVTVGSEALYRKEFTGAKLADKINEVRTLLKKLGADTIPVGTADSWNKLIESDANPAIEASDIILANAFSYWQGQKQDNATHSFFDDIMQALDHVQTIKGDKPFDFWVGETNWPTGGKNYEDSVPSVANAASYWKNSICAMVAWGVNVFVFEAFDEVYKPVEKDNDVEHHWGVWDQNYKPKYDLSC